MDVHSNKYGHSFFRFGDGGVLEQYSNQYGLSRAEGPARVEYRPDGTVRIAEYWKDGRRVDCAFRPANSVGASRQKHLTTD
jgi:hypothetical protein